MKEVEAFQIFIFSKKYKAKGLTLVGRNEGEGVATVEDEKVFKC